jgi:hypothetical protein
LTSAAARGGFAAIDSEAGVAPLEQAGEGFGGQNVGVAQAAEEGVAPEFTQVFPAAGGGQVKMAVVGKHAGGGEYVDVGVPEEVVAKGLHGNDQSGLPGGTVGACTQPAGEEVTGGVVEFAEQGGGALKEAAQEAWQG